MSKTFKRTLKEFDQKSKKYTKENSKRKTKSRMRTEISKLRKYSFNENNSIEYVSELE